MYSAIIGVEIVGHMRKVEAIGQILTTFQQSDCIFDSSVVAIATSQHIRYTNLTTQTSMLARIKEVPFVL